MGLRKVDLKVFRGILDLCNKFLNWNFIGVIIFKFRINFWRFFFVVSFIDFMNIEFLGVFFLFCIC